MQRKLQEVNKQKEEEMLLLADQVDDKDKAIHDLREKYQAALQEIRDLQEEHERDKEDLLETIR